MKGRSVVAVPNLTIGIDLGDKKSQVCVVDGAGEIVQEGAVRMRREAWVVFLKKYPGARVAMEVGTHSPWLSRFITDLGHEVFVANPSAVNGGRRRRRRKRNDKLDAQKLARLARIDPGLLKPIRHRGEQAQVDLAVLQSRDVLVKARTKLINHVRGSVKAIGARLPRCSADAFGKHMVKEIPEVLEPALGPVLRQIAALSAEIKKFDKVVEAKAKEYPETERLRQVKGVGPLTSLCYVLVLENPKYFPEPRAVGSYVGLVPCLDESSEDKPQLGITKAGCELLRRYLVQSSHYILGPFGPDTDLRLWGLSLMLRGGKNAKKRAGVAVARKLSVLLHRLWETGEVYEALRNERERAQRAA